jgi:polar amino acid transport system substrate-binding protein
MKRSRRGLLTAVVAVGVAGLLGACSAGSYTATPLPATATPTPSAAPSSGSTTKPPFDCGNPVQSYDPLPSLTGAAADAAVAKIRQQGRLRVGVSADSLLLGSRNPVTGEIEGFDIDMAKAVAKAIFNDESKIERVVITTANRIPALEKNDVDLVVRNMTMNCDRWGLIAFSSQYFQSNLKLLVPRASDASSFAQLSGKRVCAPNGSTSLAAVKAAPGVIPVGSPTHTGCLVLFQDGEVDAIAGDDTVLAGLVSQDPYAKVPEMAALGSEPYGIGVNKEQVDFVRYVNRVVDTYKADGRWKASYERWFADALGPAPQPPASVYGRT